MFVLVVVLALAATAPAENVSAPAADPNEKICENMAQIGSRLAMRRVCATRAEWVDRRQQDRKDAEAIQRQLNGSTCTPVKTNGVAVC
jgi:hypothetical protein